MFFVVVVVLLQTCISCKAGFFQFKIISYLYGYIFRSIFLILFYKMFDYSTNLIDESKEIGP